VVVFGLIPINLSELKLIFSITVLLFGAISSKILSDKTAKSDSATI
jgi:hypothetical protein